MKEPTVTLDEWLEALRVLPRSERQNPDGTVACHFPMEHHFEEYLARIHSVEESELHALLLRFLTPSTAFMLDRIRFNGLPLIREQDPEMYERMMKFTFNQRLHEFYSGLSRIPPWEGITWVLDLLPHFPADALRAMDAYFQAHCLIMSDAQMHGHGDAQALIRARYIGTPGTHVERLTLLRSLSSRDFEHLTHALYTHMKYEAVLTPPKADGGRDVLAKRSSLGMSQSLVIECKQWAGNVGVLWPRALLGVVSSEKVNKGVLVTSSAYTRGSKRFAADNPRIELVSGLDLIVLLNEHVGTSWAARLDKIIQESKRTCATSAAS